MKLDLAFFLLLLAAVVLVPIWGLSNQTSVEPVPSEPAPVVKTAPLGFTGGKSYPASPLTFSTLKVDEPPLGLPLITNVQIIDFNRDGRNDILTCDASRNCITIHEQDASGNWAPRPLIEDVAAPAHATCVDIDRDGDLDVIVSILGNIFPDDKVVGRVELFEQTPDGMVRHVILDQVRRVADVQAGDFDGDGDTDLAVAVFGYSRGEVLWLENHGSLRFEDHLLLTAPGTIHVPVADFDGDGDLDITAIVSQDEEELWGFENDGKGNLTPRRLWFTINFDLGSAGLVAADLDQDGDMDLVLPVGDNLEDYDAYPQPYHGCYWFENQGGWTFKMQRIADLGGTYAAQVGDLDNDGDEDVVLVSMTNEWYEKKNAAVVWLENDGQQNFKTWQIASDPIHLVTVAVGDLNADGKLDIVAGALNFRRPYDRVGRVAAWVQGSREVAQ